MLAPAISADPLRGVVGDRDQRGSLRLGQQRGRRRGPGRGPRPGPCGSHSVEYAQRLLELCTGRSGARRGRRSGPSGRSASGWGSSRIRHGSPGSVPVVAGVQHHPGPLLERHRDAQVARAPGPARWSDPATSSCRAASERTASASTSSEGRASRKSTMASTAVSSAMVYAPSSTGPVVHQVHHGRDQPFGHRRLPGPGVGGGRRVVVAHDRRPAVHVSAGGRFAILARAPRRRCGTASR